MGKGAERRGLLALTAGVMLLAVAGGCGQDETTPRGDVPPLAAPMAGGPVPTAPAPQVPIAPTSPTPAPAGPAVEMPVEPVVDPAADDGTAAAGDPAAAPPLDPAMPVAGAGAAEGAEWETLIEGDWTLPGGVEGYRCVRQTLQEDVYIGALEALSPPGTHHTVLGIGSVSGPDATTNCSAASLAPAMVFGSGVGTDTYRLPEGVALRLRAGQQLLLNLHLFNTTPEELSGSSGTRIQRVDPSTVEHFADNILAGSTSLSIPPGAVTQMGRCTMSHDVTLISVFPHMHQLGVHLRATAHSSVVGDVVIHDGPYDFDQQTIFPIDEVPMSAGDQVSVECEYANDTGRLVGFGDSSLAEMCFLGVFRYPASDSSGFFICTN